MGLRYVWVPITVVGGTKDLESCLFFFWQFCIFDDFVLRLLRYPLLLCIMLRVKPLKVAVVAILGIAVQAGVTFACPDSTPAKEVCEAATALNLDTFPDANGVADLKFGMSIKYSPSRAVTVGDPCNDGINYDLSMQSVDIIDVPSVTDVVTSDITREVPELSFGCEPGLMYTLIMLDAKHADARGQYGWPKFYDETNGGQSMHWIEHNIVCSEGGTGVPGQAPQGAYLDYVAPGAFEMDPFNYGFYVYEQNGTVTPSFPDFNRDLALSDFVNYYKSSDGNYTLRTDQGPVARSWVHVTTGPYSANLWKDLAGGEYGWLHDGACRALSNFAALSDYVCPSEDESSSAAAISENLFVRIKWLSLISLVFSVML